MIPDRRDIEKETLQNENYRKVLYTVPNQFQLVLMCLRVGEDIPKEKHKFTTQFIRIEEGNGRAVIGDKSYILRDGVSLVIPPNTNHYIKNTSKTKSLKLYAIYTPDNHPSNEIIHRQPSC